MVKIVPSILTNSPDDFEKMIRSIEPYFSSAHLDIADGIFVPNTTIQGTGELEKLQTKLKISVHLMVSEPENILERWLNAEVEALIFHTESTNQVNKLISDTKVAGKMVGIAINPDTSAERMEPFIDKVDFVLFLTVNPGFYGSEFREDVLEKIREFRRKHPGVEIRVDGGINPDTARRVADAGADVLIVGSYFFKPGQNIGEALEKMGKAAV